MVSGEDTEAKLLRLVGEKPGQGLTSADLVRLTGKTRQRVHQVLREHGYEVKAVWVRRGGKKKPPSS